MRMKCFGQFLLLRQCNFTARCYRQYERPFLFRVKCRWNHIISSCRHFGQLLNVKARPETEWRNRTWVVTVNLKCKDFWKLYFMRLDKQIQQNWSIASHASDKKNYQLIKGNSRRCARTFENSKYLLVSLPVSIRVSLVHRLPIGCALNRTNDGTNWKLPLNKKSHC